MTNKWKKNPPGVLFEDDPDIKVTYPEGSLKGGALWIEAKSLVRDIVFAALTVILILVFVVQPVKVDGTSMQPKLENEERIFVNKFIYNLGDIKRGDIVVFYYPDDPSKHYIKRIIGLPGESIRIDPTGQVYINGIPKEENYLTRERMQRSQPLPETYIKPHYYFVMGDNRDASDDSRRWGLVPEKYIYGKAMFRYWPLFKMGVLGD